MICKQTLLLLIVGCKLPRVLLCSGLERLLRYDMLAASFTPVGWVSTLTETRGVVLLLTVLSGTLADGVDL